MGRMKRKSLRVHVGRRPDTRLGGGHLEKKGLGPHLQPNGDFAVRDPLEAGALIFEASHRFGPFNVLPKRKMRGGLEEHLALEGPDHISRRDRGAVMKSDPRAKLE